MVLIFESKFTSEFTCESGELLIGHLHCILNAAIHEPHPPGNLQPPSPTTSPTPTTSNFRIKSKKGKWITKRICGFNSKSETQSGVTSGYITYHESCDPNWVLESVAKRECWIVDYRKGDAGGGGGGFDGSSAGIDVINRYQWGGHQTKGKNLMTPTTGWSNAEISLDSNYNIVIDPINLSTLFHSLQTHQINLQNRIKFQQPFIGTLTSSSNTASPGVGVFLKGEESEYESGWILYERDEQDGIYNEAIAYMYDASYNLPYYYESGRVDVDLEGGDILSYEQSLELYEQLPDDKKLPTNSIEFDHIMAQLTTPNITEFILDGWLMSHEVDYILDHLSTKLQDPQNTIKTIVFKSHEYLQYSSFKKILEAIKSQPATNRVCNVQVRAGVSAELGAWMISELSKLEGVETIVLRNPVQTGFVDSFGRGPEIPFAKDVVGELEMLVRLYLDDDDLSQMESFVGFLELEKERMFVEEMVGNAGGLKGYLEREFAKGGAKLLNLELVNCGVGDEDVKGLQALCGANVGIVNLEP
ncbi:hypothetical protein HDU76_007599 [Blyttiomyces sp. JEL0837]|nr:hypothetical protein HDU76_007599 [Blyttiomyces sp. JEL0837]